MNLAFSDLWYNGSGKNGCKIELLNDNMCQFDLSHCFNNGTINWWFLHECFIIQNM